MKLERLIGLLNLLATTDKITVQELADRFEVSRRTIFRDLDSLNRAGIPIVSYPGIGGGVAVLPGYKVEKSILSSDDTEKLFTALNGLKSIGGDPEVTNLIAKLVPGNAEAVFSQSGYVLDLSSWFSDSITHGKITELHRAVADHRCIRLEYISKNSRSVRVVEPYQLVFKQSSWYLYAFCRKQEAFRLFKVRRVVSYETLEECFLPRPVETMKFPDGYGSELFSSEHPSDVFEVILEYDSSDEFELTDKIDAVFFHRAKGSRTGQIRFQAANREWTADLVFSLLGKVRVISPPELQMEIKRRWEQRKDRF